jgi:acid phosphatase type 7
MRWNTKPENARVMPYATCLILAFLVASLVALSLAARPSSGQSAAPWTHTLVGAGDIARCDSNNDEATARLVGRIPGTVFTLGDNVQVKGAASEFTNCYGPSWGRFKNRTRPAVGNHEYYTPGAGPYYWYFGAAAGAPGRGYYAYKRGSWLVVVLNSNCDVVRCDANSAQVAWLRNVLAKNPARCTVAMFHHPLFSTNAPTPWVRTFWNVLYRNRVDLILNGHAHSYERFAPQRPGGTRDTSRGIRQIVAGTGGAEPIKPFGARPKNSVVRNDQTRGVLKLTLRNGSYNWNFVPVAGKTFTDSGGAKCV